MITHSIAGNAQINIPGQSEDPFPKLPSFVPPKQESGSILPRIPLPSSGDTDGLAAGKLVFVRSFQVSGNTVLTTEELLEPVKSNLNREVSFAELSELRDRITNIYIDYGYISSGATLPPQNFDNGVIKIHIIEGRLTDIDYHTSGNLTKDYIQDYLDTVLSSVLNINVLELQLQYLKQNKRIAQVQAVLVPGNDLGESILRLNITETKQFHASAQFDNYQSPSVGSVTGRISAAHTNLTGFGDTLEAAVRKSEGLLSYRAYYQRPVHARDTNIAVEVFTHNSDLVEPGFSELDFESRGSTYAVDVKHSVYRSLNSTIDLSVRPELRRTESYYLDGIPFEGENKVSVVRIPLMWTYFGRKSVFALYSTVSWGKSEIEGAAFEDDARTGFFSTWLGQFQWVHRIPWMRSQLIIKTDMQLSDSHLLAMEQFPVGGHASVRGYRENTLVGDNGFVGSMTYNFPLWRSIKGKNHLYLSTFVDLGHSWNTGEYTLEQRKLLSVGVGVNWTISGIVNLKVDWAKAQRDIPTSPGHNLQDDGIHFRLVAFY